MEKRSLVNLFFSLILVSTKSDATNEADETNILSKVFSSPNLLKSSIENSTATCEGKCYDEIGCFPPVSKCLSAAYGLCSNPDSMTEINTTFMFFSKKNQYNPFLVNFNLSEVELQKVPFDPKRPTFVLVHGYDDRYTENITLGPIKNLYLNKMDDANVIAVDWSKGASNRNFAAAKANAKIVGSQIALALQKLNKIYGVNLDSVMMIGFSLGGQAVAYAANFTEQRFNKKVGRIIGLDAAGICFDDRIFWERDFEALSPQHATLVEALHTNSAPLGYGFRGREGHYDYYPNGGNHQPGCVTLSVILSLGFEKSYCSHLRKQPLYAVDYESFGECQPVAYNCSDYDNFLKGVCASCDQNQCQLMALGIQISRYELPPKVPVKQNLNLYLKTTDRIPFCMFHFQVKASLRIGYKPKSIDVRLIGESGNETVSLTAGPFHKYYALLTIPEIAGISTAAGPFRSAVVLDVFVDGNNSVNIIEKLQVNYMSNIDESVRSSKSTVLCPTSEYELKLCPQHLYSLK